MKKEIDMKNVYEGQLKRLCTKYDLTEYYSPENTDERFKNKSLNIADHNLSMEQMQAYRKEIELISAQIMASDRKMTEKAEDAKILQKQLAKIDIAIYNNNPSLFERAQMGDVLAEDILEDYFGDTVDIGSMGFIDIESDEMKEKHGYTLENKIQDAKQQASEAYTEIREEKRLHIDREI